MLFSAVIKALIMVLVGIETLAVALVSSAYSGGIFEILVNLQVSEEVGLLGYFALRHWIRYRPFVLGSLDLTAGSAGLQNIWTLIILWFFAGCLGSALFAVSGGIIADAFPAISRGLASGLYCAGLFLRPTLGPIIGSFLSKNAGW
ncbi:hypothetical protein N7537_004893 [Penicillium hordei]|uniref:Major facilitator superfamily (MFS) profile domain-containing protein n=1 Tax=Penicillium hordei TaxID=40994 RepID=A0AAD6ECC1_9EURO|nr:uncharacterized protein N7537_004893 [Penicillium hordei]KAJ5608274.1 hypothetical protein N7537_004893 [Penicillium hordei]